MSPTAWNQDERLFHITVRCPRCRAHPNQPCVTWEQGVKHELLGTHNDRKRAARRNARQA